MEILLVCLGAVVGTLGFIAHQLKAKHEAMLLKYDNEKRSVEASQRRWEEKAGAKLESAIDRINLMQKTVDSSMVDLNEFDKLREDVEVIKRAKAFSKR